MIRKLFDDIKQNKIYMLVVILLLCWFSYKSLNGIPFFAGNDVQKNAGYIGPVPHSGYGTRFYHK